MTANFLLGTKQAEVNEKKNIFKVIRNYATQIQQTLSKGSINLLKIFQRQNKEFVSPADVIIRNVKRSSSGKHMIVNANWFCTRNEEF